MRRCLFGAVLLVALLTGCLLVWWGMERIQEPVTRQLLLAAELSDLEENTAAEDQLKLARECWQRYWRFTAAFADHGPMEEIDGLLASLTAYAPGDTEFSAGCRQLAEKTRAIARAHALSWWNLL